MGTWLQTRATRKDPQARFEAKWKLVQLLYRRGWDKQRIIDRIGIEKGVLQDVLQSLLQGEVLALQKLLSKRFGVIPAELAATIAAANAAQLDVWLNLVLEAPSLDAIFKSTAH